jgi:2-polyprenyl-3-methyl-5-hydroxy-6-metoxy-1,4-benzoquinol methylase
LSPLFQAQLIHDNIFLAIACILFTRMIMKPRIDVTAFNKNAWNKEVEKGNEWTIPVSPEEIAEARLGNFKILLTPTKPVPQAWFPFLKDSRVLCLASGGGQQGPLLAAAGAVVTVFDNSPLQLNQDRLVAAREKLEISTVEGDMSYFQSGKKRFGSCVRGAH